MRPRPHHPAPGQDESVELSWRATTRLRGGAGRTPVAQSEFVRAALAKLIAKYRVPLDRIPVVNDLQSASLLWTFCAATRANFSLRRVPPELALQFAAEHDANVWQCFCNSQPAGRQWPPCRSVWEVWASAEGTQPAAHWADWADAMAMILRTPSSGYWTQKRTREWHENGKGAWTLWRRTTLWRPRGTHW